jgi:hypothetical protein
MNQLEKLFDGAYNYFDQEKGVPYSQEIFSVHRNPENNFLIYRAEILSRVTTGEFLKINTYYEVNTFWAPQKVIIEKTLGANFAKEIYTPDYDNQILNYEFINPQGSKNYSRNIVTRYQITTPAISTSMLSSQTKKFDSMSRNAYILVSCSNAWEFEKPFEDKSVFVEYKTHESKEIIINGSSLACIKCLMYQTDTNQNMTEEPTTFYLSKHVGIPYLVESKDIKIEIKYLHKAKSAADIE